MSVKNGMKPAAQKLEQSETDFFAPQDGGLLSIPPRVKQWLEEKGWEARFVNALEMQKAGGYHKNGWRVAKLPADVYTPDFSMGGDADGYLRRGDAVLAVLPKEHANKRRTQLADKSKRQQGIQSQAAEELRGMMKGNNIKGKIHEGYEDNE